MQVILLERVEKLGRIGDVVDVKPGYARNFLLPRGKALRATEANRTRFEAERERIEAENAKRREAAEAEGVAIDGASVVLIRQASNVGALYGSVSARDIAEALVASGHKVAKSAVVLDRPIKALGIHDVRVSLHAEVSVGIKVNVARSEAEAELQAKGVDVMAAEAEEERAADAEAAAEMQDMFEEAAASREGEDVPEAATEQPDTSEREVG
ncbi:MAG: 50S ribosomal protein L9 [Thermaurantiacus sp.]